VPGGVASIPNIQGGSVIMSILVGEAPDISRTVRGMATALTN
jgi:hypothetical protein